MLLLLAAILGSRVYALYGNKRRHLIGLTFLCCILPLIIYILGYLLFGAIMNSRSTYISSNKREVQSNVHLQCSSFTTFWDSRRIYYSYYSFSRTRSGTGRRRLSDSKVSSAELFSRHLSGESRNPVQTCCRLWCLIRSSTIPCQFLFAHVY